jgi:hypothetical protein
MRTRLMIAAAATATLLAGAAFAQPPAASGSNFKQSADTAVNPPASDATPYTAPVAPSADSATVAPAAGAPTERAPAATAGTDLVTNGPVPDTKENRAKYGMPMSNAGRRTQAAGN